jgi:hypothetical protein
MHIMSDYSIVYKGLTSVEYKALHDMIEAIPLWNMCLIERRNDEIE